MISPAYDVKMRVQNKHWQINSPRRAVPARHRTGRSREHGKTVSGASRAAEEYGKVHGGFLRSAVVVSSLGFFMCGSRAAIAPPARPSWPSFSHRRPGFVYSGTN
jgi:hypothetical protein